MLIWQPNIGDKWYGTPVVIEPEHFVIRSITRQTINSVTVKMDELFICPKLASLPLEQFINQSITVSVLAQRIISGNRKIWQCAIQKYERKETALN